MSFSARSSHGNLQESNLSDTIRDEIGDEQIDDKNGLFDSENPLSEDGSFSPSEALDKLQLGKFQSQPCNSTKFDSNIKSNQVLPVADNNFQRRASIFDSVIGGFGSKEITTMGRSTKQTFLGSTSSKSIH